MKNSTNESTGTQTDDLNTVTVCVTGKSRTNPFSNSDDFEVMADQLSSETDTVHLSSDPLDKTKSPDSTQGVTLNRRSIIMSGVAAALASIAGPRAAAAQEDPNDIDFTAQDAIGLSHTRKAENFRLDKSSQLTVEEVQGATEDEVLEVTIDIAPKGGDFGSITNQKFTLPGVAAEAATNSPRFERVVPEQSSSGGGDESEDPNEGELAPSSENVVKKTGEDAPVEENSLGHMMRFHAARSLAPSERDLTQHHDQISLDDFHIDASIEELTERENRIVARDYHLRVQLLGSGGTVITSETQTITVKYGLKGGPGVRFAYNPLLVAPTDDTRSLIGN